MVQPQRKSRRKLKCPVCHMPNVNEAYCIQCGYDYIRGEKARLSFEAVPAKREEI